MRLCDSRVLLLANYALVAVVQAEALPPDSIPINCATICGPMVELSSICSGKGNDIKARLLRNKRQDTLDRQDKQARTVAQSQETTRRPDTDLAQRDFTVIVPAPTSFPSSLVVQQGTVEPPRQSRITRIRPTQILPTQKPPPPPPPASSAPPPPPANTGRPETTSSQGRNNAPPTSTQKPRSTMQAMDDDDGDGEEADSGGDDGGSSVPDKDQSRWSMNNGEKDCVCENNSFDVQQVAALCSSCIAIASNLQNDMDVIMTTCKFASQSYSPDKDKLVNNVRVQATPPKTVWGQNAGVESAGSTLTPIRIAAGVAAGLSLLWLR